MRPLASPVVQQRTVGFVFVATAAAALVLGLVDDARLPKLFIGIGINTGVAGALFAFSMLRAARRATAEPAPVPPQAVEEGDGATVRRTIAMSGGAGVLQLATLAVCAHLGGDDPGSWALGGIPLGIGLASLAAAQRLAAWERRHGARLLREQRYRGGWRGRGASDSSDLFARPA